MRVIAGALKGRRLKAPGWPGLRPTSDKLRETLFNVLAARIAAAHVLDGYAGTGALGIEALSRGAAMVTFIESDRRAQALIAENVALCDLSDRCAIIRASVGRALEQLRSAPTATRFDIVLLDPPYESGTDDSTLAAAGALLAHGGLIVLEHSRRRPSPVHAGALVRVRELHSGDSTLSFYESGDAVRDATT